LGKGFLNLLIAQNLWGRVEAGVEHHSGLCFFPFPETSSAFASLPAILSGRGFFPRPAEKFYNPTKFGRGFYTKYFCFS
jgi:hypothetical protein